MSAWKKLFEKIKYFVIIVVLLVAFLSVLVFKNYYYYFKYKDVIFDCANNYDLDYNLVCGVIKAESGFNKNAHSNKNAYGLMQITTSTYTYVLGLQNKSVNDYNIYDVKTNVDVGCYYLNYLSLKFSDEMTILASYNAGEGVVSLWLNDERYSTDGKTLINIPYKETANYIDKVFTYKKEFEKLNEGCSTKS